MPDTLPRLSPAPRARPDETAATVRARLRQRDGIGDAIADQIADDWPLLCVLDGDGRLLGTLGPAQLLALDDAARLDQAMQRQPPTVTAGTDPEHMASLALHHGLAALPVVDGQGRLLGVASPQALMEVLRREHVEDLHRLAGIARETDQARQALEAPPLRRARHRLPWLLVGLLGSVLATWVVARFESALAARPALAFFIPGLVYLADAIGTQSEAVAVRGLSLSQAGLGRLIGGELRTGALIGGVLALAALPLVGWVFDDAHLAAAVALALAAASLVASSLGLLLPWALGRLGGDPAYGSGPLATIVQDLLSLLIYFGCVSLIVL